MVTDGQNFVKENRLVAVVVTHNRLDEIKLTTSQLLKEPCQAVVVVDNGTTDGTRVWLNEQTNSKLHVVLSEKNLGGAGGFELGLRVAFERFNPDWVVVMDDDARPETGTFQNFLETSACNLGIIASAVYLPDGSICEMNRPSRNPFWHLKAFFKTLFNMLIGQGRKGFHISNECYAREDIQDIDAASFVGMFISREVVEKTGLPDGKLFIYGDDVEYCLRARNAGFGIGFAPFLRFQHACSTLDNKRTYGPIWKVYYNYRNGLFTYKIASGMYFPIVFIICVIKWALNGHRYGVQKRIYYKLLWKAVRDGLMGRRTMEHEDLLSISLPKSYD